MHFLSNLGTALGATFLVTSTVASAIEKRTGAEAIGFDSNNCSGDIVFYSSNVNGAQCSDVSRGGGAVTVAVTPLAVEFGEAKFYRDRLCVSGMPYTYLGKTPAGYSCYQVNGGLNQHINGVRWHD